jgi:hypothetical protein
MFYVLFWVIPLRLNFICQRFIFNHSQIKSLFAYLPIKMEQTECYETSAYKIQTPGNYPEENIQLEVSMLYIKTQIFQQQVIICFGLKD